MWPEGHVGSLEFRHAPPRMPLKNRVGEKRKRSTGTGRGEGMGTIEEIIFQVPRCVCVGTMIKKKWRKVGGKVSASGRGGKKKVIEEYNGSATERRGIWILLHRPF